MIYINLYYVMYHVQTANLKHYASSGAECFFTVVVRLIMELLYPAHNISHDNVQLGVVLVFVQLLKFGRGVLAELWKLCSPCTNS